MKRLGMLRNVSLVVGASALAALMFTACGDDDGNPTFDARPVFDGPITNIDARPIDAGTVDARPPDAPGADAGPTFSGTAAIHDVEIFGLAGFHGLQMTLGFTQRGTPTVKSFSEGTIGCSYSIVDVNVAAQNPPTVNEGTIKVSLGGTALPDCTLQSGAYRCIAAQGASGTLAAATMNPDKIITFTNTTASAPNFAAGVVGAYLIIPGATPADTKAFPITGVSGTSAGLQLVTTPPASPVGPWFIAHGIGPQAYSAAPDGSGLGAAPDLLTDTTDVTVQIVPGGGNHVAAYTSPTLNAADKFTLDTATTAIFTDGIDINGTTDLTFACTGAGCDTGGGNATIVNIETTDVAGGGPTELLPPTQYRATIQCNAAFASSVKLTAGAIAYLKDANTKKMRISFFRDNADITTALARPLSVAAGHGIVTFKAPKAPPTAK